MCEQIGMGPDLIGQMLICDLQKLEYDARVVLQGTNCPFIQLIYPDSLSLAVAAQWWR